jgi:diapolycopene oxygenase
VLKKKKAVVVGSGIAGIASAIRLAVKGYSVHVLEKNSYAGGKLTVLEQDGFRFDAGPSLFTMPHFVEELFILAGKNPEDYFEYGKSDVACHYFFEDGTFLPFYAKEEKLLKVVEETLKVDPQPLKEHFERSAFIYRKTSNTFLEMSLHKWKNYFSKDILDCLLAIPKLSLFNSMHEVNEKKLNHPKLVQIFDRYATYNGSNPYAAPGILNVIPHLEHGFGTFFPKKGIHDIPMSLLRLAAELGVEVVLNEEVKEILVKDKKVVGVQGALTYYPAEVVVCNSDIRPAYQHLLPSEEIPKKVASQEPSSSALIFYWGIDKTFDQLDLHNIFFSEDYQKEFKEIFDHNTVGSDPTVYIHVSSKMVKGDAPEGKENWFVMINVPANSGQNWEELRLKSRVNILAKLSRLLGKDIESLIVTEDYLDPIRIEERTSSFAGALYGASSNDRMAAFFRHPNFSKVAGLYFVGGSVHPGGGIPLCLLSAKIACGMIN